MQTLDVRTQELRTQELAHDLAGDLSAMPDLVHRVRSLRFFETHFRRTIKVIADRAGIALSVDRNRLVAAFLDWGDAVNRQRAVAAIDRRDYIVFSAGLLLEHLLAQRAVSAAAPRPRPAGLGSAQRINSASASGLAADTGGASSSVAGVGNAEVPAAIGDIAAFWPEGFSTTAYCVAVLEAVLRQEAARPVVVGDTVDDLRTWWSFRENAAEDPRAAIGYFDLFVGNEPNWEAPANAGARPAIRQRLQGGASSLNPALN
ncbi:hypothetical protein SAMN02745172_04037 [Pseudoxanthobacter soli DSM 19599]|uniref:Uncharacterized protein n=1 Tax=Pseudoxanthobacter soli DSM 19599 TaxID=1123029 RepID=A0A1M7ZR25_9HYPH|nr:hypothetical protein [Pseudoxanthobacter soli]SHO67360.1 hypothetical protein SAMN02745172_04037 [Pseudoxanthobacter soli DSM 19599]